MVLYRYCVSFFAQWGKKNDTQGLNMTGKRKSYLFSFVGCFLLAGQKTTHKK